jgi:alkanesulfonate monooxygenase SsuD/methylene tetrahydromethanopterin reductase-like flavin-dependent oxidoreductase (luciferase family)
MDELEEAVLILKAMWSSQPASFEGRHHHLSNAWCQPLPAPPIPLLIGGGGEKRTLAIAARSADWWNFNSCSPEVYAHKLSLLKAHCARIGRDPRQIRLSYLSTASVSEKPSEVMRSSEKHFVAGTSAQVIEELEQFAALGVTHCMFRFLDSPSLQRFVTTVVPHFL